MTREGMADEMTMATSIAASRTHVDSACAASTGFNKRT